MFQTGIYKYARFGGEEEVEAKKKSRFERLEHEVGGEAGGWRSLRGSK